MKRLIQSRRINAVAVLTAVTTIATLIIGVAPENWTIWLELLALAAGLLAGAGPGVHGVPITMTPPTLARAMFAAYNRAAGGKTWDGKPIPPWEDTGDRVQANWIAAARLALRAVRQGRPTQPAGSHPVTPRNTREILDRTRHVSLILLTLALMSGCGAAQLVSVEPVHAWVEGDTEWHGAAHVTPGEPSEGEWSGDGQLDTGATVELCVARGKLSRPVCTEATLGLYIEHHEDGAVMAVCWSAVGGILEDCTVIPLTDTVGEQGEP